MRPRGASRNLGAATGPPSSPAGAGLLAHVHMRWIVGLDRLDHTLGAPQLARWLATPSAEIIGVHVVEHTKATEPMGERLAGIVDAARDTLRAALATTQDSPFSNVEVVLAADAATGLASTATRLGVDGVLVDRRADRIGKGLVRLGRVARRLVRTLPVPVIVTPHDLQLDQIGKGPIMVAIDLDLVSVAAVRFAVRLGSELNRPLRLVHVSPGFEPFPSFYGDETVPPPTAKRRGVTEVEMWLDAHQLPSTDVTVLEGSVIEALVDHAREIDPPLVVCGTQHLSPLVRLFSASVASDLARLADRAVLVVSSV
jgi:nucleotide-binding universal stress UspA family protein